MGEHPLLRFLSKDRGPIVRLQTYAYPENGAPQFWYSLAELSDDITGGYRSDDVLKFCGAGWANNRLLSQEKAIIEAVERWAFRYYANCDPIAARLDIDPTSNGFAALPAQFDLTKVYANSLCEAFERFILNQIWLYHDVTLEDCTAVLPASILQLFNSHDGSLNLYRTALIVNESLQLVGTEQLQFVIAVFSRVNGGVLPGSACGNELSAVAERASLEAFNHLIAIENIDSGVAHHSETITDRRLVYFGTNVSAGNTVRQVVKSCMNGSRRLVEPNLIFMDNLQGPWNPEVNVARAVVEGSLPITEGDETRFLI